MSIEIRFGLEWVHQVMRAEDFVDHFDRCQPEIVHFEWLSDGLPTFYCVYPGDPRPEMEMGRYENNPTRTQTKKGEC
jgi:hypothetical protein